MTMHFQAIEHPLTKLGFTEDDAFRAGGFGGVASRSGVGKTSLVVQLGLHAMMRNENVLHVSLKDPIRKINLWYSEVYRNMADSLKLADSRQTWETVLPRRFIMTLRVDGFSIAGFEERLDDLIEQNIFIPNMVVVDGLPFEGEFQETVNELKRIARKHGFRIWFTVLTHRHENRTPDGIPPQLKGVEGLFDIVIELEPSDKAIRLKLLKGGGGPSAGSLIMAPDTLLIGET